METKPNAQANADHAAATKLANRIWQVADLLRGDFRRSDYGKVILPFTVLQPAGVRAETHAYAGPGDA